MPSVTDPCRIPESRYLYCGFLSAYVTPPLVKEFHPAEDRKSFGEFVRDRGVALDPVGEFAYSVQDYEDWLRSDGRI